MKDRKILIETRVGSHLYGTNRPESDDDFQGVFLPSKNDLLGVENCPTEWSLGTKISTGAQNVKGDVDRKFYGLKRFFHLASEGQPGQLELFFTTPEMTISYDPIWSEILDNIGLFLSKKSIVPFIGFALSQAHKATMKGETLNKLQRIIAWYNTETTPATKQGTILDAAREMSPTDEKGIGTFKLASDIELKYVVNSEGFMLAEIGGKNYDIKLKLKTFVNNLKELEARYGSRSRSAAEGKYDFKSLMHAYRLLGEGEELLKYGKITFPRPTEEVAFLKSIRLGTCGDIDHWTELTNKIDRLRQEVEPKSHLPKEANHAKINELCIDILSRELGK